MLPIWCKFIWWLPQLNKFSSRKFINSVLELHSSCKKFIWFSFSFVLLLHPAWKAFLKYPRWAECCNWLLNFPLELELITVVCSFVGVLGELLIKRKLLSCCPRLSMSHCFSFKGTKNQIFILFFLLQLRISSVIALCLLIFLMYKMLSSMPVNEINL